MLRKLLTGILIVSVLGVFVLSEASANDFETGVQELQRGNNAKGISLLLPLADSGHVSAQSALSGLYATGQAPKLGAEKVLGWLVRIVSGEAGNPKLLGRVPASSFRFPREMYYIGAIYMQGIGVPSDYAEALKWLRRSSDRWYPPSFYLMGLLYKFGQSERRASEEGNKVLRDGVIQDNVLAYMWLEIASNFKVPNAERDLAELSTSIDPEDKVEGKRLAREWLRKYLAKRNAYRQRQ
ncbi:MAG: TPR repeat protein [Paracoccaceae bacterium]|jgi:TPR repeat protein